MRNQFLRVLALIIILSFDATYADGFKDFCKNAAAKVGVNLEKKNKSTIAVVTAATSAKPEKDVELFDAYVKTIQRELVKIIQNLGAAHSPSENANLLSKILDNFITSTSLGTSEQIISFARFFIADVYLSSRIGNLVFETKDTPGMSPIDWDKKFSAMVVFLNLQVTHQVSIMTKSLKTDTFEGDPDALVLKELQKIQLALNALVAPKSRVNFYELMSQSDGTPSPTIERRRQILKASFSQAMKIIDDQKSIFRKLDESGEVPSPETVAPKIEKPKVDGSVDLEQE
jgi:hypothetical protein